MAKEKKRPYWLADDDDGRTIVDMSGIRHRNILFPHPLEDERPEDGPEEPARPKNRVVEEDGVIMDEAEAGRSRPWENRTLDRKETRAAIFGALGAGMLLVTIFIAAGGLFILFLLGIWT